MNIRDQGINSINCSSSYRLLMSFILAAIVLFVSCNCLPYSKEKKPHRQDTSQLSGAVSEIEDALSRLKQYAKDLKSESEYSHQADEDPLPESIERESRDEDYRQEPELVPGLDRFEKSVDEAKEKTQSEHQSNLAKSLSGDNLSDVSLQDLVDFLRDRVKDKKNGGGQLTEQEKTTTKTTLGVSQQKDISVNELIEFLKERRKEMNGKDVNHVVVTHSPISVIESDSKDLSLNEALEYLASLKKKLNSQNSK